MKKGTADNPSLGQLKDLVATLVSAIPSDLTKYQLQALIGSKRVLVSGIKELIQSMVGGERFQSLLEWQRFYSEVFGVNLNIADITVPPKLDGFDLLVVIAKGSTANRLFAKCREQFRVQSNCTDFNASLDPNFSTRITDKSYAIWVRKCAVADVENKNLSANDLAERDIPTITLQERLILELFYYWKMGIHLDIKSITLCAGSRSRGGDVPSVDWCHDRNELFVSWYSPEHHRDALRGREVAA